MRIFSGLALACCLPMSMALAVAPVDLNLPQIGEPADLSLSPAEEREAGRRVVAQLHAAGFILDDPQLTEYISSLGWNLATYAQNQPERFTFFMVRDPSINAFALPGGYVGFNAGLLIAARNESEVAGVMGHELVHVTQRHIARTIEGTKVSNMATMAAMLAAIVAGAASGNGDVILGALGAGSALSYQNQVNYTRSHELEADRLGIRIMAEAGYDPHGMSSFFQRLEQQSRLYGSGLPEILRTHPVNTTRIAEAESRARDYALRNVRESDEFPLMQARATVLSAGRVTEARDLFLERLSAGDQTAATRYGAALALSKTAQVKQALEILQPALDADPRNVHLQLLQAQLQLDGKRTEAALATLDAALEHQPRYVPVIFAYADALIAAGRAEEARQFLLDRGPLLDGRAEAHRLLADAAQAVDDHPEVAFQRASYFYERGNPQDALRQIDAGLRIADMDDKTRARLTAFRSEVRGALPSNWRPEPEQRDRRR